MRTVHVAVLVAFLLSLGGSPARAQAAAGAGPVAARGGRLSAAVQPAEGPAVPDYLRVSRQVHLPGAPASDVDPGPRSAAGSALLRPLLPRTFEMYCYSYDWHGWLDWSYWQGETQVAEGTEAWPLDDERFTPRYDAPWGGPWYSPWADRGVGVIFQWNGPAATSLGLGLGVSDRDRHW